MLICLPWQLNTFLNPDFCAGKNILATCPWEICQNKICFYCESLEYNRWIYGGGRGAFWSPHPWGPRVNIYTFINIMPTFISQAITVTFIIGIFHFPFHHTGYYSDFTAQFIRTWVVGILQWFHHTVYPDLGCTDITVISPHSLSGPGLYGYYSDFAKGNFTYLNWTRQMWCVCEKRYVFSHSGYHGSRVFLLGNV